MKQIIFIVALLIPLFAYIYIEELNEKLFSIISSIGCIIAIFGTIQNLTKSKGMFSPIKYIYLRKMRLKLGNVWTFLSGVIFCCTSIYFFDVKIILFSIYTLLISIFLITTLTIKFIKDK